MSFPISEETLRRLKKWEEGKKQGPTNLELYLTEKCNLNCRFCGVRYRDEGSMNYKQELDWKEIKRIIEEAAELGVETFFITGGEPSCRKDILIKAMKLIKQKGMVGHLVTNGTLFEDEDIKQIVSSGWEHIMVSVDSPVETINDYLRGSEGALEEIEGNLERIKKWKDRLGREFPVVILTSVITNVNFETIPEFVNFAKDLDVDEIRFQPLILHHDFMERFKIKGKDLNKLSKIARDTQKLMDNYEYTTNVDEFVDKELVEKSSQVNEIIEEEKVESDESDISCYQPWYGMKITSKGKVGPCESDFTKESPVNVKERSLEDVWYGNYFQGIRNKIKSEKLPDECSKCCIGKVFEQREIREGLKDGIE